MMRCNSSPQDGVCPHCGHDVGKDKRILYPHGSMTLDEAMELHLWAHPKCEKQEKQRKQQPALVEAAR